jgi:hypothetical protein
MNAQSEKTTSASLVVEHLVPKGKGLAFRIWHASLFQSARQFKGFVRIDLCPPVKAKQLRWYSITHFDSAEHLNHWLQSEARAQVIAKGQKIFESYQFKSFATGLEGWFSHKVGSEQMGLGPPAWKQNLAVVLGLYPTVMLQSILFAAFGIMTSWSMASSMVINNLITSSLLTWLVMPFLTKLMRFWLQPAHQAVPPKNEILGTGAIAIALSVMVIVFRWLELDHWQLH